MYTNILKKFQVYCFVHFLRCRGVNLITVAGGTGQLVVNSLFDIEFYVSDSTFGPN